MANQNKDMIRLNIGSFILAIIITILAVLVYKGTVRFLDTPFGFVREQLFNIHVPKMLEVFIHIGMTLFFIVVFLRFSIKLIKWTKFIWYL
jgi:hypothetical protein